MRRVDRPTGTHLAARTPPEGCCLSGFLHTRLRRPCQPEMNAAECACVLRNSRQLDLADSKPQVLALASHTNHNHIGVHAIQRDRPNSACNKLCASGILQLRSSPSTAADTSTRASACVSFLPFVFVNIFQVI
jgi:hypothetical protein